MKISRIAIVVIYLALIRCISEVFRLNYLQKDSLTIAQIMPFLIGALIASIACLLMTLLSFYAKHKTIIAIAFLTIIALLIVKSIFSL